jgi:hypothetical protein
MRTSKTIINAGETTMLPDGENISANDALTDDHVVPHDQDPYLVSLVTAANDRKAQHYSENITIIVDELQGTASRRRSQLLNSGR